MGSSAISSLGSQERAMAIITRWRRPPESSWGYSEKRRSGSGIPTSRITCSALSRPADLLSPRCARSGSTICLPTLSTGVSDVIGFWKTMAISAPQKSWASFRAKLSQVAALEEDRGRFRHGGGRREYSHDRLAQHGFPRPGFADDPDGLAGDEIERHPVDGSQVPALGRKVDFEIVHLQLVDRGLARRSPDTSAAEPRPGPIAHQVE